jgi:superfamily II DNA/RNA helicase
MLQRLRDGRMRVLVATDVAARGIDVPGISHVINFDAPRQAEDYIHRIGRTGRAGRPGVAVTLLAHRERHLMRSIERYTGAALRVGVISGLEPAARPERGARPAPERNSRGPERRPEWKRGERPANGRPRDRS